MTQQPMKKSQIKGNKRKIAGGGAPVIGRGTSGGVKRDVELDSGVERREIVLHDGERRRALCERETA